LYFVVSIPTFSALTGSSLPVIAALIPILVPGLEKLGYKQTLVLQKRRERFIGRGLELVIDRLADGQKFLELRTADPAGECQYLVA
jgi:hypothetical protein